MMIALTQFGLTACSGSSSEQSASNADLPATQTLSVLSSNEILPAAVGGKISISQGNGNGRYFYTFNSGSATALELVEVRYVWAKDVGCETPNATFTLSAPYYSRELDKGWGRDIDPNTTYTLEMDIKSNCNTLKSIEPIVWAGAGTFANGPLNSQSPQLGLARRCSGENGETLTVFQNGAPVVFSSNQLGSPISDDKIMDGDSAWDANGGFEDMPDHENRRNGDNETLVMDFNHDGTGHINLGDNGKTILSENVSGCQFVVADRNDFFKAK